MHKIGDVLDELARRKEERRALDAYASFYGWQREFTAATATHTEVALVAANQVGKTRSGCVNDAMHLLGDYPDGWEGHRFGFAPNCWCLGYSMEKTRDLLQKALFGVYVEGEFEGGFVPKSRIVSWESAAGTANAMRSVRVRHVSGETSTMQFWSYSQGNHALMGDVVDWVHVDEEPRDQTIRPQVLTRTINGDKGKGGRLIYTFTPENGRTELVIQFMDTPSKDQFFMQKGWDDAPHISPEKADRLLAQYPAHQRDMRSKGSPMLGHGRIYDVPQDDITAEPFPIPAHWPLLNGLDFGWDHNQSHIQMAFDFENDIYYVTHAWKARQTSANDAWGAVKPWAQGILTAWPHDGLQHEKGRDDSRQQKDHYQKAGFRMLFDYAQWPDKSRSVEQGIYEIRERMLTGRFKVFAGLNSLFEEFRQYHRDENGRIVKTNDDVLDAVRYAFMMKNYAKPRGDLEKVKAAMPQPIRSFGTGSRR